MIFPPWEDEQMDREPDGSEPPVLHCLDCDEWFYVGQSCRCSEPTD